MIKVTYRYNPDRVRKNWAGYDKGQSLARWESLFKQHVRDWVGHDTAVRVERDTALVDAQASVTGTTIITANDVTHTAQHLWRDLGFLVKRKTLNKEEL